MQLEQFVEASALSLSIAPIVGAIYAFPRLAFFAETKRGYF